MICRKLCCSLFEIVYAIILFLGSWDFGIVHHWGDWLLLAQCILVIFNNAS
jgi:hypothetical protein